MAPAMASSPVDMYRSAFSSSTIWPMLLLLMFRLVNRNSTGRIARASISMPELPR
jgi:hypothetical protein